MDDKLKQRLVGAIVLVALGVIVVPVMLDGSGRGPTQSEIEIPARAHQPQQTLEPLAKLQPVPKPGAGQAQTGEAPAAGVASPSAWVIQVGSFKSESNAQVLRDKLRQSGYPAFVEPQEGKARFRVRVGPELDKRIADELRNKLEREHGQAGIVVRYP